MNSKKIKNSSKVVNTKKIPDSPSAADTHLGISNIVNWMSNRGLSLKEKLDSEEKLMLYRFGVKSYNRYKSLVGYLTSWIAAFVEFTEKVSVVLQKSSGVDILFIVRNWFIAFNEVLDEFLLLKFGGISCKQEIEEHQYFLVDRNISTKEYFPNQPKFEHFTSCSFFGYRDLCSLIEKASKNVYDKWENFLITANEDAVEKELAGASVILGETLVGFGKCVADLPLVESCYFYEYNQSHHDDMADVRYDITVEGKRAEMNKTEVPERTQRSLAYHIKSHGNRSLGHVKINQEVLCVPHSDTPKQAIRYTRARYISEEEDINDVNEDRERAVIEACEADMSGVSMAPIEEGESEDEDMDDTSLSLKKLTVAGDNTRRRTRSDSGGDIGGSGSSGGKSGSGGGGGSGGSGSKSGGGGGGGSGGSGSSGGSGNSSGKSGGGGKRGRPKVSEVTDMSESENLTTPSNGIPLKKFVSGVRSSSKTKLFHGSDSDSDVGGDKGSLILLDENMNVVESDSEADYQSDSEDDELEKEVYSAGYALGAKLAGPNRTHAARSMRKVNEISVFEMHRNITDRQVRTELFHAVMGKMMANNRIISAIAGHHMQNPTVQIDWLAEAAVIKLAVCKTLNFAPPVSKKESAMLVGGELEVQILSGAPHTQSIEEIRRNNKLNKQANRATYQVVHLVINTCLLLKQHPEYVPPIVDSSTLQLMSDDDKGMHYLEQALYQYPDENLHLLQEELARCEANANNLAPTMAAAKVKKYSGNWKGVSTSWKGSGSSGKKRKRADKEEKENELNASAKKALKDAETLTAKIQKDNDITKKDMEVTKKKNASLQLALDEAEKRSRETVQQAKWDKEASDKRVQQAKEESELRVKEEAEKTAALRKEFEEKLASKVVPVVEPVVEPVSTSVEIAAKPVKTIPEQANKPPSDTALGIEQMKREIEELEQLKKRRDELKRLLSAPVAVPPSAEEGTFRQDTASFFRTLSAPALIPASAVVSDSSAAPTAAEVLQVLREKVAPIVGNEFNFGWFLEGFLNHALGKTSPSLPAILTVVNRSDWDSCILDAQEILVDNKMLISDGEKLVLDANLGKLTNHNLLLALFACTSLEHELIKGILFKLLYTLYQDNILGVEISYANKFVFIIKKRGEKFDHKLCNGISFSFFHTAEYFKYMEGEGKREGKEMVDLSSGGEELEVA